MGFAMFGAVTFLPLFLQDVKNVSPTLSGLRLFPLMFGLFGASIISGRLVTRWGRYKIFPILGTACMTLGAFLLSLIGIETTPGDAFYMFVFGVGLGLTQQVLVVAVQNAVSYEDLGVATSGATFFRMIGGSFGTAVFGAIYANVLATSWRPWSPRSPRGQRSICRRWIRHAAPVGPSVPEAYDKILGAITASLQTVFLVAVPIAAFAFLLSWLLPELPLRRSISTLEVSEGFGLPEPARRSKTLNCHWSGSPVGRIASSCTGRWRNEPESTYRPSRAGCSTAWRIDPRRPCRRWPPAEGQPEIIQQAVRGLVAAGMVSWCSVATITT